VLIQRESGGNLTEMLSNLSRLIRERLKLHAKIRVLSSEGRMSAWILGLMPLPWQPCSICEPGIHVHAVDRPHRHRHLQWLAGLMVIGMLMLRRIVRIRV
jgi:tight adherence protein B